MVREGELGLITAKVRQRIGLCRIVETAVSNVEWDDDI